MAVQLKTNPVGIDVTIDAVAQYLHDELASKWGVSINGYSRVYKNSDNGKLVPQHYLGGGEYTEGNLVVLEDNRFFFTVGSDESVGDGSTEYKARVNLYVIVNLSQVYSSISDRADTHVRKDVLEVLEVTRLNDVQRVLHDDLRQILSEFDGLFSKSMYDNMQPYHIFKVETDLIFDINDIKNCT